MNEISFSFDDKLYKGRQGEPMAAALLRSGLLSITNSTYHSRPRGVVGLGVEEPNALVQLVSGTQESMLPATVIEVAEGLAARSLTGVGTLPELPDEARYDKTNRYVDTLVVGAGVAGLIAADEQLRAGRKVLLIDDQPAPGGHLRQCGLELPPALQDVFTDKNLTYLCRCTAIGLYDQNYVVAIERRSDHLGNSAPASRARIRVWHIRADQVVLAPGAFQRLLIFANNDRPGIMLSHAAATYIAVHRVQIFRQAIIATVDNQGYRDALRLQNAGVQVQGIFDARPGAAGASVDAARAAGIPVRFRTTVLDTVADAGGCLQSAIIQDLDTNETFETPADLLAVSGGWTPIADLPTHIGVKPKWSQDHAAFLVNQATDQIRTAGMLAGDFGGDDDALVFFGPALDAEQARYAYIDLQRDTTLRDIQRAAGAGLHSIEHIKRYTTIGTAHDQGKTSGMLTIGALCQLNNSLTSGTPGLSPADVGILSFRPPYVPVPFAALAGRERGLLSDPIRITPLHQWHVKAGAIFEDVGQWKRPWYFPKPGESTEDAIRRECLAARQGVAIMDASTLGKIDIQGPDADAFLDRIYTNIFSSLQVGQCRYGLMCKTDGMVFDDGVTTRLGKNHFLMTTTTGGAAAVLAWLEEWLQTEWPELKVYCTSVTEHLSTIALVGPKSRHLLQEMVTDIDLSTEAFPFMHSKAATIDGIPVRIARISFSGELAFEINVTWGHALHIWERLWSSGLHYDLTAYGTETMHVLRAEKGYVIIGQDTDGTQTPFDLNMSWIVSKKKEFIGKRSFQLPYLKAAGRRQLVGLLPENHDEVIPEGAYITLPDAHPDAYGKIPHTGFVTSSYYSPTLGRAFALALVANGLSRMGELVAVPTRGKYCSPPSATPYLLIERMSEEINQELFMIAKKSPLEGMNMGNVATVAIRELPGLHTIDLRVAPGTSTQTAVAEALAIDLPGKTGQTRNALIPGGGEAHILCLAPDWWLMIGFQEAEQKLAPLGFENHYHFSVVDVSGQRTAIELEGPHAPEVLAHLWEQDLREKNFPVTSVSQGLMAKAPVIVWHIAPFRYRVLVRSSFALHLWKSLVDAAVEWV